MLSCTVGTASNDFLRVVNFEFSEHYEVGVSIALGVRAVGF